MTILKVDNLKVYYDAICAVKDVSFHVNKGEMVALIGGNGAGKTTILHTISGLIKPTSGSIVYNNIDLLATKTHKIATLGLVQVPEGRRIFQEMTVDENLQMGAYFRKDKEKTKQDYAYVLETLPRLKERTKQAAGTLSGGEQQMLAIGRALMSSPNMLLLDEPSMGLSPLLVEEIFGIIKDINKQGVTVLLVEQNAKIALEVASRGYVLETGQIVLEGSAKELASNPNVQKAYLGG